MSALFVRALNDIGVSVGIPRPISHDLKAICLHNLGNLVEQCGILCNHALGRMYLFTAGGAVGANTYGKDEFDQRAQDGNSFIHIFFH